MGPCILYKTCTAVCSYLKIKIKNQFREDCSWDNGHCCCQTFGTCIWLYGRKNCINSTVMKTLRCLILSLSQESCASDILSQFAIDTWDSMRDHKDGN